MEKTIIKQRFRLIWSNPSFPVNSSFCSIELDNVNQLIGALKQIRDDGFHVLSINVL